MDEDRIAPGRRANSDMRRKDSPDKRLPTAEDILSAKWSIPVMRVLAQGPARFSGIRIAIPAISANILAGRLRNLEEVGIVRRKMLPPPADCPVYALTDMGEAVRPVLLAIEQWASFFQDAQRPGAPEAKGHGDALHNSQVP